MKNSYLAVLRLAIIATILAAIGWSAPTTVRATDYVVNDLTDTKPTGGGNGSTATLTGDLRFCVTQAGYAATGSASTITFTKTGKITLEGHELPINDDLTINGPGSASLTIDAAGASRVFYVAAGHTVQISGLTLTGGNGVGNDTTNLDQGDADHYGGAVLNDQSALTINDCTITINTTNGNGHSNGGGVCNLASLADATLTMDGCAVTSNTASGYPGDGGGIANVPTGATATMSLSNTTISGNTAGSNGGGLSNAEFGGTAGNVTINHGTISGNTAQNLGGGVFNAGNLDSSVLPSAFISIADSQISGNASHAGLDDIGGGGLLNTGGGSTLSLLNCLVENNTSDGPGGGISNALYAGDGNNSGPVLTMGNCTVSANTAAATGGGIYNYGAFTPAAASIENSTISGNTAGQTGGGISNLGNNFSGTNVTFTVNNTTLSGNAAQTRGGGVYNYSSLGTASVVLANCTVAGNSAVGGGGGIANDRLQSATTAAAAVTLGNTLVALNATGANFAIAYGTNVSNGFNLSDDATGSAFLTATGDQNSSTHPGLQVDGSGAPLLQDNGVPPPPTLTVALLAGSAAIDAGMAADDPATGQPTTIDQRGYLRPAGKASDIGAFESGSTFPPPPVIDSAASAVGQAGAAFSFQIAATNSPTSFIATGLPGGLVLNPVTGIISGTPVDVGTAAVTFTVNLTAVNVGGTGLATLGLQIAPAGPAPVITGATSASGQVNTAFNFQIVATHSPTSYAAAGLPAGLALNLTTGLISGTPTVAGFFNVVLSATNSSGTGSGPFALTVAAAAPLITSATTAAATIGEGFSFQIVATQSPTAYAATGLPDGLSINAATGVIIGTPTTVGTYTVMLSATNDGGTGTATLLLTVSPVPAPSITSADTATGQVGVAFSYTITATHFPTSFSAVSLPVGLSVDPVTGIISGTPTTPGTAIITLEATNATGTGTATLVLTIQPPPAPSITSALSAGSTLGQPFTYQITATGFPTSYAAVGLPTGLSIDATTGLISGAPSVAGTAIITLEATNATGTGTATLVLTIAAGVQAPVITSALSAGSTLGQPFTYQITAINGPTSFSAAGLPAGLSVDAATGLISGTPATPGTAIITLGATNATGTGTAKLTLTVASIPVPVITSVTSANVTLGQPFTYQITATNSPANYAAADLPAGLSVDAATGLISGAPTQAGTFTLTLTASNAGGSGTAALTLIVIDPNAPPSVTIVAVGDGTVVEDGGKAEVLIKRTGDLSAALTVRYKVQGSAKAGVDYKPLPGSVTIPAGASQTKFKLKAINNTAQEGTRVAKIKLLSATDGRYTLSGATVAKVKIVDNG